MKQAAENYTFNATAKTLTLNRPQFGNNIDLARLLLITDVTAGVILYQFNGGGVTVSGNVLTFASLPGNVQSSDTLQIIYDFPEPASTYLDLPDTNLLSDDIFDRGACGWEELNVPATTLWTSGSFSAGRMPLTLGTDGHFGAYTLRLTTANVNNASYAGVASAMKRMTHQAQPGVTNKGIVRAEWWFTYGSDGSTASALFPVSGATYTQVGGVYYVTLTINSLEYMAAGTWITVASLGGLTNCGGNAIVSSVNTGASTITYPINATPSGTWTSGGTVTITADFCAPRSISFEIDSQTNTDSATGQARTAGTRSQFVATWLQASQTGSGIPFFQGQWLLGYGSGVNYGASGYFLPNSALFTTGYFTDFCPNENKRNLHYLALVMDTRNGLWLGLQANDQFMDLTSIPNNSNGPLASVLSPTDPNYNLGDYIGGCNQYIQIVNQNSAGVGATYGTASWLELHRARMSYL
jgi:hypothetical protein